MRKIEVSVSTGYVGSKRTDIIEVEDDMTEEEINELALEAMFEMLDYGWHEIEDND